MKLLIHFGIYKAGSSYLQYICANQKDYLIANNIYFPESKEDEKMKKGLISKGNSDGFEIALKKEDTSKINTLLKKWHRIAKQKKCNAVLISAEALVHQLGQQRKLNFIVNSANSVGYTNIKAMGFFRDLSDHALSTYKHRAKSGKIPDYEHWVKNVYETPTLLENLTSVIADNQGIKWTLRKFQKDSEFLNQAFFKDWLGIEIPDFQTRPNVNESISLSEVKVMNHIRKTYPNVTDYFYEDFKKLQKKDKADDKYLDAYVLSSFAKNLAQHDKVIQNINTFFAKNEQLVVGEFKNVDLNSPTMKLSDTQFSCLMQRIQYFKTFEGKITKLRRRVVGFARKISITKLSK